MEKLANDLSTPPHELNSPGRRRPAWRSLIRESGARARAQSASAPTLTSGRPAETRTWRWPEVRRRPAPSGRTLLSFSLLLRGPLLCFSPGARSPPTASRCLGGACLLPPCPGGRPSPLAPHEVWAGTAFLFPWSGSQGCFLLFVSPPHFPFQRPISLTEPSGVPVNVSALPVFTPTSSLWSWTGLPLPTGR